MVQLVTLPFCPESPRYILIDRRDQIAAKKALLWLRYLYLYHGNHQCNCFPGLSSFLEPIHEFEIRYWGPKNFNIEGSLIFHRLFRVPDPNTKWVKKYLANGKILGSIINLTFHCLRKYFVPSLVLNKVNKGGVKLINQCFLFY